MIFKDALGEWEIRDDEWAAEAKFRLCSKLNAEPPLDAPIMTRHAANGGVENIYDTSRWDIGRKLKWFESHMDGWTGGDSWYETFGQADACRNKYLPSDYKIVRYAGRNMLASSDYLIDGMMSNRMLPNSKICEAKEEFHDGRYTDRKVIGCLKKLEGKMFVELGPKTVLYWTVLCCDDILGWFRTDERYDADKILEAAVSQLPGALCRFDMCGGVMQWNTLNSVEFVKRYEPLFELRLGIEESETMKFER